MGLGTRGGGRYNRQGNNRGANSRLRDCRGLDICLSRLRGFGLCDLGDIRLGDILRLCTGRCHSLSCSGNTRKRLMGFSKLCPIPQKSTTNHRRQLRLRLRLGRDISLRGRGRGRKSLGLIGINDLRARGNTASQDESNESLCELHVVYLVNECG